MKVQLDTVQFALHVRTFGNDDKKAAAWLRSFADTLLFEGANPDAEPLAASLVNEAGEFKAQQSLIKMRAAAVKAVGEGADEDALDGWMQKKYGMKYDSVKYTLAMKEQRVAFQEPEPVADEGPEEEPSTAIVATKAPRKLPYGEFHNVMLTEEEQLRLYEKVDNAAELIEELSQYLASSGRRYKSHYATLLNWSRRHSEEAAPKQKFLTTDEISRRNYEQSQQVLNRIMEERRHG
jgi:hypothetical protein